MFRNVRVPKANLLGEEGGGFALAQARLGPGRIHHCMRTIGQAELALDLMVQRSKERKTFGRYLHEHGPVAEWIALSRCEIEQARLLVLKTAWMIDTLGRQGGGGGNLDDQGRSCRACRSTIVDRAMQTFGAMGLSPDTPLAGSLDHGPRAAHRRRSGRGASALDRAARTQARAARTSAPPSAFLTPPLGAELNPAMADMSAYAASPGLPAIRRGCPRRSSPPRATC